MNYKLLFNLSNKTALITGAAGLLGVEFAKGLAAHQCNLILVDSDDNKLKEVGKDINNNYDVNCNTFCCNITDQQSVEDLSSKIKGDNCNIDILINNVASKGFDLDNYFAEVEKYSIETWNEILNYNLTSMFIMTKIFGSVMAERGHGSIIQTSSIYGVMAPDQRIYKGSIFLDREINTPAIYSASKAGVIGLTKYLATYWASAGVRVNTLTPGGVFSGQNKTFVEKYSERVPMNRMADKSELVGAVVFLSSDASSYITGQNLIVDGGLNCW